MNSLPARLRLKKMLKSTVTGTKTVSDTLVFGGGAIPVTHQMQLPSMPTANLGNSEACVSGTNTAFGTNSACPDPNFSPSKAGKHGRQNCLVLRH